MLSFADRLVDKIRVRGNACIVGLDPRIDEMPSFVITKARLAHDNDAEIIRFCIREYHQRILGLVGELVPAVKLQIAFYEQYGIPGLLAFQDTIAEAKKRGLIVIVDAKRNDIGSTAKAYANALLGATPVMGASRPVFDVDCITVSPYLGIDSLEPFVQSCTEFNKGIFVLVKTSNKGSSDLQDLEVNTPEGPMPLYMATAKIVDELARKSIEACGYSSIGAVVGATFPQQAEILRKAMPHSIFLVPGYGAQGGTAKDVIPCFNPDNLGAVVNASRSVTYEFDSLEITEADFDSLIRQRAIAMIGDINAAIGSS